MTVGELIEVLSGLDKDLNVFVSGYEGGYDLAEARPEVKEFYLDVNTDWYYGPHEMIDSRNDGVLDNRIVSGIIIK
jgi:hypothetical protein